MHLFTSARLWPLSSARWIQFAPIKFLLNNFNIILIPCIGLRCGLIPSGLPIAMFSFPALPHASTFYFIPDHSSNIWPWVQIMKLVVRQLYSQSLSNLNYKILKVFHSLHFTFLKSYGRTSLSSLCRCLCYFKFRYGSLLFNKNRFGLRVQWTDKDKIKFVW